MKIRSIVLVVLLMAIAFLVGWTTAPPQRWQYRAVCSEMEMKDLGHTGWELVTATINPGSNTTCFYLKRPL